MTPTPSKEQLLYDGFIARRSGFRIQPRSCPDSAGELEYVGTDLKIIAELEYAYKAREGRLAVEALSKRHIHAHQVLDTIERQNMMRMPFNHEWAEEARAAVKEVQHNLT